MTDEDVPDQDPPRHGHDRDRAASAIVKCLAMLAEEADALRLAHTLAALRESIEICAAESADLWRHDPPDERAAISGTPGHRIH